MTIILDTLDATRRLAEALGAALQKETRSLTVLLEGGLGAGKTTLTRFLVESLPGGGEAEVSSPSFTLWNIYPTQPEIWHCDLYRLEDGLVPEDFIDALYHIEEDILGAPVFMIVEWPERLPAKHLPDEYIHCRLTAGQNDRRASFTGYGKSAEETLERMKALLPPNAIV